MTLNFLIIGDTHFKVSNIPEVELFMERITQLALDKKPDRIIILGDQLDTHEKLHTIPLNKSYKFITTMRSIAKTYILVGNHDMISNSEYLNTNHWMNSMKEWDNLVVVDKILTETIDGHLFVFSPYVYPSRFEEALNTLNNGEDWRKAKIIFCHQEFKGCKMGSIISIEGDKWPIDYPDIISGHIHSNQRPQKNIYYPGSAMQHAFGESKKNIIAFISIFDTSYYVVEIDLNLPRKKIIYTDMSSIDTCEIDTKNKVRLTVSGNQDEFKSFKKTKKYRQLINDGVKIIFKAKNILANQTIVINEEENFYSTLNKLVLNEQNTYLSQTYDLVIKNK